MIMQDLKRQRHEMLDPFFGRKNSTWARSYFIYRFGEKLVFAHSL